MDPERRWKEVALILVDDDGITAVNREYLDKPDPTDVISFIYDPMPGDEGCLSGEIIVNAQRAFEEGTRRGNASRELALYVAHGCLHLAGKDDRTPAQRARMRRMETSWLTKATALDYVDSLFDESGGGC